MKVQANDPREPVKPTQTPGQFQRVLQQAGGPQASHRAPAPPRPALPPSTGKPTPRLPLPSERPTAPAPSTARAPGGPAIAGGPVVLATTRSALATPENLGQARQVMHGEAQRLRTSRTEAQTLTQERTEHRVSELISRELVRGFQVEPAPVAASRAAPTHEEASRAPSEGLAPTGEARHTASTSGPRLVEEPDAQLKTQAALELIEKIEVFVRSQRPALRMSLGAPLTAMVEVERTGPREVALRIQGRDGPLAHEDLARIRDALGARGLRLRSLRAE
ncbi:hypothetical protein [Hyalangium rubrum]|uniref:Flagellar hook-length control protein-like C-terminal domain-containing protein n=1 Tax=Hyalangium rubrum TaxID=3103134 RepID=A0ABU5HBR4_9BACT|nr:hypothetical protein [Hyalangium sp. s54d21]MDY7230912.1 hypothetical protein [Hyalangium sp. s54d21]